MLPQFARLNTVVYGASHNTLEAQYEFACKYGLSMPLLSDPEWTYRKLLGNPDGGELASRITYVIDAQGIVRDVIGVPRIAADEHPQAALDSLRSFTQS